MEMLLGGGRFVNLGGEGSGAETEDAVFELRGSRAMPRKA